MILLPFLSSNLINWFIISINNLTQNPVLIYFSFRGRCHQEWIIYRWGFQFHLFFLFLFFRVVSPLIYIHFFFSKISLPPPLFFLTENPYDFFINFYFPLSFGVCKFLFFSLSLSSAVCFPFSFTLFCVCYHLHSRSSSTLTDTCVLQHQRWMCFSSI